MKHSQTIGILLTLLLFFCTTQPLVIIESRNWVITGWDAGASNFGQSGKFLFYIGILAIVFFAIPSINVKRFNMAFSFICMCNGGMSSEAMGALCMYYFKFWNFNHDLLA